VLRSVLFIHRDLVLRSVRFIHRDLELSSVRFMSIMENTFRVDARYSGFSEIGKGSFGVVCSAYDSMQVRGEH